MIGSGEGYVQIYMKEFAGMSQRARCNECSIKTNEERIGMQILHIYAVRNMKTASLSFMSFDIYILHKEVFVI